MLLLKFVHFYSVSMFQGSLFVVVIYLFTYYHSI